MDTKTLGFFCDMLSAHCSLISAGVRQQQEEIVTSPAQSRQADNNASQNGPPRADGAQRTLIWLASASRTKYIYIYRHGTFKMPLGAGTI